MIYSLTGTIYEAIPQSYTNKETGEVKESVKVTIEQRYVDADGHRKLGVQEVTFPKEDEKVLRESLDKYITVSFQLKTFGEKSYMARDNSVPYLITDTHPFQAAEKKQKAA
ncbi:hypothetical protein YH65_11070 [Sulfurovum lithotrophicum]|uniref:Single-stranded DNA-binding protein n=1 Tax=Sulfurovum lithotrophicum TaxID=206403 RepID=A0A7U4M2V7_9BACT|nr:hypothetical protein [Sulfurovum lithotrophicum]AKF25862.1 hypothetical protein YH65_11070 [Sulfurovum lithotrophicum]